MIKSESLKKTRDFSVVYQKGKSIANRTLVLYVIRVKDRDTNRVGRSGSKKVGNSVCRNRARRLMKEAFRKTEAELPVGYDFLLIARHTILDCKCQQVEDSLRAALKRIRLI